MPGAHCPQPLKMRAVEDANGQGHGPGSPYLPSEHLQLLLLQTEAELLLPCSGLLLSELSHGEVVAGTVARGHPQGAASTAGHAGEALAPGEVEDGDAVESDTAGALAGSPLQDGWSWMGAKGRGTSITSLGEDSRKHPRS